MSSRGSTRFSRTVAEAFALLPRPEPAEAATYPERIHFRLEGLDVELYHGRYYALRWRDEKAPAKRPGRPSKRGDSSEK